MRELDGAGGVKEQKRKDEIRAKLQASLASNADRVAESANIQRTNQADFFSAEEIAAEAAAKFNKSKKKKKKKLRTKTVDAAELEADGMAPVGQALGSRRTREEEGSAVAAATAMDRDPRDAKFAHALMKARVATDENILAEIAGDDDENNVAGNEGLQEEEVRNVWCMQHTTQDAPKTL